uniref:non-specific serine/threonine protein kinase n=1 Tax=Davidia involucrata TaxID=16924 RepID=A0A5B6ZDA3_DAVIN
MMIWANIFFFLIIIIPYASPLNFNLSSITTNNYDSIKCTGGAYISSTQGIQVTPDEREVALGNQTGRATYIQPLHLWDKGSGNLTDFTTHFSFIIDSDGDSNSGDGLAFFLAPVGSSIPTDADGSGLGLASRNQATNSSANQFVAVEFDTFPNSWELNLYGYRPHVGININSMNSVTTALWRNNVSLGIQNDAWITYTSSSQNLSVVFTGFINNQIQQGSLNYVVDLREVLPEWVTFGFSAATGALVEKHSVQSWEFNSTTLQVDDPVAASPSPNHDPNVVISKGKKKTNIGLVVGLTVGLCVLVGGLALIMGSVWWKKRNREDKEDELAFDLSNMDDEFEKGTGPKKFSYGELSRATNSFAEEQKLGEGGFGGVYRGFLRDLNSHVAVKRVSRGSKQGLKEYASEVKIFSRLRHRNLVQLIGWCHEKRDLLLVYEFMPNCSLDSHLFKENSILTWAMRYKIAQGLASALLYLHEEWEQCVVHRDIKSSNIMLDSSFNAKLGDFGLARLVDHGKVSQTTVLAGTMGYMAPECVITGKASKESDVYSFGVVALEIACGRKPIFLKDQESQIRIVEWVWDLYGMGKLLEAADPKLCAEFDEREMERLMIVGLWCAHPDNNLRPSIRQAIHVLNFEASVPILPSKMPVATYLAPPLDMHMPTSSMSYSYGANVSEGSSQIQSSSYSFSTDSSKVTASSSPSASLLYTR